MNQNPTDSGNPRRFSLFGESQFSWMAMSELFNCMGTDFVQAFQLGKRPHLQIWVAVVAGMNAIGLSFYLIPREGPVGAAIAVAATSVVTCVHSTVAGRYAYPIPLPISGAARVGVCAP